MLSLIYFCKFLKSPLIVYLFNDNETTLFMNVFLTCFSEYNLFGVFDLDEMEFDVLSGSEMYFLRVYPGYIVYIYAQLFYGKFFDNVKIGITQRK